MRSSRVALATIAVVFLLASRESWASVPAPPDLQFAFSQDIDDEWSLVTAGSGIAVFATTRLVRLDGSRVTIVERWEYENPRPQNDAKSSQANVEYDCDARKLRLINVAYFAGNHFTGDRLPSEESYVGWQAVWAGSAGEAMMEWACAHSRTIAAGRDTDASTTPGSR